MNKNLRIALFGPKGIGKTTAITTLCECPAFDADAANLFTDINASSITTLRIDFGEVQIDSGLAFQIYGCPITAELKFVRLWLLSMVSGAIFMADLSPPEAQCQLIELLNEAISAAPSITAVILVVRPATAAQLDAFGVELKRTGLHRLPLMHADVRDLGQISEVFRRIASMLV